MTNGTLHRVDVAKIWTPGGTEMRVMTATTRDTGGMTTSRRPDTGRGITGTITTLLTMACTMMRVVRVAAMADGTQTRCKIWQNHVFGMLMRNIAEGDRVVRGAATEVDLAVARETQGSPQTLS